ncbi:MAG: hypothetical protein AAFQ79_08015 [Pseudomonadota bacterium]
MQTDFDIHDIDLNQIEQDARRLRAKVIRDGFAAMGAWLRSHLSLAGRRTA